jgi:hypothetical protein
VSQETTERVLLELERQRLDREREWMAAHRRSTLRIVRAVNAAYRARNCVWVPELGPCNVAERAFVRKVVAPQITFEAAMGAWFTPPAGAAEAR